MPHLCKKTSNGRTYWYLRETQRVGKKVCLKWQKYLGTPETILARLNEVENAGKPLKLHSLEFGSLFILHELEKIIDTVGIVDTIIPSHPRETGPSIGEYFFFAWVNRLIEPLSKRALGSWFANTDIDSFRPVRARDLTSQRFWQKWNRVQEGDIEAIAKAFFSKIWSLQETKAECILFDTTNFFTYMNTKNPSILAKRGKNKAGKNSLRQIGLALLVDRHTRLPLFFKNYPGNKHDSKLFKEVIDEMFGILQGFNQTKERLTIVFDKGMNGDENLEVIDDHQRIHFITTYSTYFAEELANTPLKSFSVLKTSSNLERKATDHVLAFRTEGEFWGKKRTVIVTYNPRTHRKKCLVLEEKLERIRQILLEFRRQHREQAPHWRKFSSIQKRYEAACEKFHLGGQYYVLEKGPKDFSFRKDLGAIAKAKLVFGRNIIITDNSDWTTEEIAQASLDRSIIEQQFRIAKNPKRISLNPMFHWTDKKIRCHLLTCAIAMTMNRLLEMKVESVMGKVTGDRVLSEMRKLSAVLTMKKGQKSVERQLEEPTKFQSDVLKAFGTEISPSWVLQPIAR